MLSHPFGDLLTQHLHRKHGLSQAKLAAGILQDQAVIAKMCKGQRLTGPQARERVLAIVGWLHHNGVLDKSVEANALLSAAGLAPLRDTDPAEAALLQRLQKSSAFSQQLRVATPGHHESARMRNNLPTQLTSFIGRADELAQLTARIRTTRLLTLAGAGGAGKTRLALEVAAQVQQHFGDGVWMIEFAPVMHAEHVLQTVAKLFQLVERPSVPLIEMLIMRLEGCQAVLIFDNCEHVIAACAALAERLLQACPQLHILATSREALRCAGEALWRVPSLSQIESQQLFVTRVRAIQHDFEVEDNQVATLVRICQQLDGMPLAIELAAARMKTLSLEQIAGRLDDRFNLLTVGNRTAIPRHQTLRTAIAWSFDLLTSAEQALMICLSVFKGGFTGEAVQAVFSNPDTDELIASLVDKSLVIAETKSQLVRYRLLETIRQFSVAQLNASGDETRMRNRHLTFFLGLAEAMMDLTGPHAEAWKRRMNFDHDNLRAAFAWAITCDDQGEAALRLAAAMRPYGSPLGQYLEEAMTWITAALVRGGGASVSAQARALLAKAFVHMVQFNVESAADACENSLALFRKSPDRIGTAWCLVFLASNFADAHAQARAEEALRLFQELGSVDGEANALECMAAACLRVGDRARAAQHLEQAIAIARWQIADCIQLMYAAYPQRALELCAEEVARWKETGDESISAGVLSDYGMLLMAERDYEPAQAMMKEYIQWEEKNSDARTPGHWYALMGLALAELPRGHTENAIVYLEQAQKLAHMMAWIGFAGLAKSFIASAQITAGNRTHAARDLRECLQLFQKSDFKSGAVCALIQIADLASREENPQHAARLLGAAKTFSATVNAQPYWVNWVSSLWYYYAQDAIVEPTLAAARAQLGDAEFEAAFATGQAMTFEQAVAYAL